MQKFRKQLQQQMRWGEIFLALHVGIISLLHGLILPRIQEKATLNFVTFIEGIAVGVTVLLVILLLYYRRALQDELALRKLHNYLNDERHSLIRQKAGFPMLVIAGVLLSFAGVVAAYFDRTVSLTLLGAGLFVLLCHVLAKACFARKM